MGSNMKSLTMFLRLLVGMKFLIDNFVLKEDEKKILR